MKFPETDAQAQGIEGRAFPEQTVLPSRQRCAPQHGPAFVAGGTDAPGEWSLPADLRACWRSVCHRAARAPGSAAAAACAEDLLNVCVQ